jgi:hypothetical protein
MLARNDIEHLVNALELLQSKARKQMESFEQIEAFCLFIGYPKSGHSLVGALLDAHPNIVIAHELDCLRCLRAGLNRDLIFSLLLEISGDFDRERHSWNGFSYHVDNQWQGRFQQLKVIGDKKGGGSSIQFLQYPRLLDRLYLTLGLPVKFIHITRHPRDNIAGISRQFDTPPEDALEFYFSLAKSVSWLKTRIPPENLFEICHETFIGDPRRYLREICCFLGQEANTEYLEACARIVKPVVPKTKPNNPVLSAVLLNEIRHKAAGFDFLAEYPF